MSDVPTQPVDRLRALPKAEVHAPLEGCFEPGVLEQWATQARVPMPRPRQRLLQFEGLSDFLQFLDWACGLASTGERLAELSYAYSKRLACAAAGYTDVIVNPKYWPAWHGRLPAMIDAIDAGLAAAEQDGLPPVNQCVSLLRNQSSDAAAESVDTLLPCDIHAWWRSLSMATRRPQVAPVRAFRKRFGVLARPGCTAPCMLASPATPKAYGTPSNCSVRIASTMGSEPSKTRNC